MDTMQTDRRVALSARRIEAPVSPGRGLHVVFYVALAFTAVALLGCDAPFGNAPRNRQLHEESKNMQTTAPLETQPMAIPPIDADAPLQTATATFALG
jgi:hypothetical protein